MHLTLMRTLLRGLVLLLAYAGLMVGLAMGVFAMVGLRGLIWGPEFLDNPLASQPDHWHPACWFSIIALPPAMLIGMTGTFFAWVVPLFYFTGTRLGESRDWPLSAYARWLRALSQPTGDFRAGRRPPRVPAPTLH